MAVEIRSDEDLYDLLASLGESSRRVADALEAAGIKGARGEASCCPVANWLCRETDVTWVEVDLGSVMVRLPSGTTVMADPPRSVNAFIEEFDNYEYPELDARPLDELDDDDPEK